MKSILILLIVATFSLTCFGKDFLSSSFSVDEVEKWLTEKITIEEMKSVFGDTPITLGSLEVLEEKENKNEEIYVSIEKYLYPLESIEDHRFSVTKKLTIGSPSISFRFIGNTFYEAFIWNTDEKNVIQLIPRKPNAEQGIVADPTIHGKF